MDCPRCKKSLSAAGCSCANCGENIVAAKIAYYTGIPALVIGGFIGWQVNWVVGATIGVVAGLTAMMLVAAVTHLGHRK